jgi:hypothetical protein
MFFSGCDLLIGILAFRPTFIPRVIGALMLIMGLGRLTFTIRCWQRTSRHPQYGCSGVWRSREDRLAAHMDVNAQPWQQASAVSTFHRV